MKRRLELAEEVLALFYETADAIRFIRASGGQEAVGKRTPSNNETAKVSSALNREYAIRNRINQREDLFRKVSEKRYRFRAMFRCDADEPFVMIESLIDELRNAAATLGQYYWQKETRDLVNEEQMKVHMDAQQKLEAKVYSWMGPDLITPKMNDVIRKVEAIAEKADVAYQHAGPSELWRWYKSSTDW
jgi:hypothetical protein